MTPYKSEARARLPASDSSRPIDVSLLPCANRGVGPPGTPTERRLGSNFERSLRNKREAGLMPHLPLEEDF
jgi:hypothetical protein